MNRLAIVPLMMLCGSLVKAQDPAIRMGAVMNTYSQHGFMGAVLVARDGRVLFEKGFGSAYAEWDIPNSPATKFRIGSITKQFTAACIFLLQERRKLKTDDLANKYFPDAPPA